MEKHEDAKYGKKSKLLLREIFYNLKLANLKTYKIRFSKKLIDFAFIS